VIIRGIKASHDGAVAVVEDGRLRFSVETEKLGNGGRYGSLGSLQQVTDILAGEAVSPSDVDQFVVDGWHTRDASGAHAWARGEPEHHTIINPTRRDLARHHPGRRVSSLPRHLRQHRRCACRISHPGSSGGMPVLVDHSGESVVSTDVQAGDSSRIGD